MKVNDARRISLYLQKYQCEEEQIMDSRLWAEISMDGQHQHFMCGVCHKIDTYELKQVEDRLKKQVYSICKNLEEGKELPVFDILKNLQGYYPILWKCVKKASKRRGEN